jgi:hypothetical protein
VLLLTDCQLVFDSEKVDKIRTEDLVAALLALEERPWPTLRRGPLDARALAQMLRRYDVKPATHRFDDITARGYLRADFVDAWSRYLPPSTETNETDETSATPQRAATSDVADVSDVAHVQCEGGTLFPLAAAIVADADNLSRDEP